MKPELQYYAHELTRKAFALVLRDESTRVGRYEYGITCESREDWGNGETTYRVHVGIAGEHKDRLRVLVFADFPLADVERNEINGAIQRAKVREQREEKERERQDLLDKLAVVDAEIEQLNNTPEK